MAPEEQGLPPSWSTAIARIEGRIEGLEKKLEDGRLSNQEREDLMKKIRTYEAEIALMKDKPAPAAGRKEEEADDDLWK